MDNEEKMIRWIDKTILPLFYENFTFENRDEAEVCIGRLQEAFNDLDPDDFAPEGGWPKEEEEDLNDIDDGWEASVGSGYDLWSKPLGGRDYGRICKNYSRRNKFDIYISDHPQETGEHYSTANSLAEAKAWFVERQKEHDEEDRLEALEDEEDK